MIGHGQRVEPERLGEDGVLEENLRLELLVTAEVGELRAWAPPQAPSVKGTCDLGRHLVQLAHETGGERDALASAPLLALPLRLPGHVDAILSLRLRRVLQRLEEIVHVGLERGEVTESCDVDRAEEMSDVSAGPVRLAPGPHIREAGAGQDPGQDIHHDGEAIALVAAQFPRSAERREEARLVGHVRISGRLPLVVERPSRRDGVAPSAGDRELADRHGAGRHVEDERAVAPGGSGHRDRIGAEHRLAAVGRDNGGSRVRHAQADHLVGERHHGVVGGRAVVIRVAAGHESHAVGPGLRDGELHGEGGSVVAERLLAVDDRRRTLVADDLRLGGRHDPALAVPLEVGRQHAHPVRVDAPQIRPDHEVGDELGHRRRRPPAVEDRDDEGLEGRGGDEE